MNHDGTADIRLLQTDDPVLVKNFNNTGKNGFKVTYIIKSIGPLSYLIKLNDGCIFHHDINHLQKSYILTMPNFCSPNFSDVNFPDQVTQSNPDSNLH